MSEEIILDTSDAAATKKTVEGWVSRNGRFFGKDERSARRDGATHFKCYEDGCENLAPTRSAYLYCPSHVAEHQRQRFDALPVVPWDGETPVCIDGTDTYFFDADEIEEHCEDNEVSPAELRLVLCVPLKFPEFDLYDFLESSLHEDADLSNYPELIAAEAQLNEALRKVGSVSWIPGKTRIELPEVL